MCFGVGGFTLDQGSDKNYVRKSISSGKKQNLEKQRKKCPSSVSEGTHGRYAFCLLLLQITQSNNKMKKFASPSYALRIYSKQVACEQHVVFWYLDLFLGLETCNIPDKQRLCITIDACFRNTVRVNKITSTVYEYSIPYRIDVGLFKANPHRNSISSILSSVSCFYGKEQWLYFNEHCCFKNFAEFFPRRNRQHKRKRYSEHTHDAYNIFLFRPVRSARTLCFNLFVCEM